ncbi:hypothetical protein [Leptospira sp. GIMC2001]|uniref:hypothetical protein n=1 Tax=Leptospira sp. GIMC2001 TaxID=1513297 RepID=UPI002349710C|nr:hypothetical protein [Leptospira sp. GIMC2001]WCL49060.1 hypothetical protein O4O04_17490 [Leptospira sp. GIMC2001]
MKNKIIYFFLILFGFSSCQFPSLDQPITYYALIALIRGNNSNSSAEVDYRLSVIYNGRQYNPGETIDLGMGDAFEPRVLPATIKNTGTKEFSLSSEASPIITSNSDGVLSLESSSQVPTIWQPGSEHPIEIHVSPGSDENNSWSVSIDAVSPVANRFNFNLSMLGIVVRPKKIFFGVHDPMAEKGLYSVDWDSETNTLSNVVQRSNADQATFSGSRFTSANTSKFIYYYSTSTTLDGFQLDSNSNLIALPQYTNGTAYFKMYSIEAVKRLALVQNVGGFSTASYDLVSGSVNAPSAALGMLCSSSYLIPSPKGDFIFENYYYYNIGPGQINVKRLASDGNLTEVYPSPFYYVDTTLANNLSMSFKTRGNNYIYSVSRTGSPVPSSFKVDSILRRTVDSDGMISSVDKEYTLNAYGASYDRVIRHPNDKFIYLVGLSAGTQGIIHVLNHDARTGDITRINTLTKASAQNAYDGAVSPDGKFLAVLFRVNTSGCPTCQENIHIYSIDPITGDLTEKHSIIRNQKFNGIYWLGKVSQ